MARRILLADDSVTAQNMGRRILSDAGYDVVTVNNGSAALKKIAENKPDLIVLDVYMPGYGGLEVCQRIKEGPETKRIPVLLTVGKLEPFKPEEARRVGADAFIVKPFEATELLTALTKLEDKIVAVPQPQKSGRFAKALAALEQSDVGERFGDKETGWKNRLTIPPPQFKPKQGEAEDTEAIASGSHDLEGSEATKPAEPKPEFERPIPAGLPADITAEEIAAITAAAAAFSIKPEEIAPLPTAAISDAVASSEGVPSVASDPTAIMAGQGEAPAAIPTSTPELEKEAQAPTEAQPGAEQGGSEPPNEAVKPEDHPAVAELPVAGVELDTATEVSSETTISKAEKLAGSDAEVMAAIASLAPANGQTIESVQPQAQGSNGTGQEASMSSYGALADAAAGATGPRWIAEAVAVAPEESTLLLEHEMDQARAASVAIEAPATSNVSSAAAFESSIVTSVVEAEEPAIAATSSQVVAAESVPAYVAADASSAGSSLIETAVPPATLAESAYAAAASAGSTAEYTAPVDAVSPTSTSPEPSEDKSAGQLAGQLHGQSDGAALREAELTAAWQNWRQIRESFVNSQPTPEVADAAADAVSPRQEVTRLADAAEVAAEAEEVAAEAEEVEAAGDAPAESTAIASIVDSMLAELRPKLVAEIAKKMNSEKKEQEKKKRKK